MNDGRVQVKRQHRRKEEEKAGRREEEEEERGGGRRRREEGGGGRAPPGAWRAPLCHSSSQAHETSTQSRAKQSLAKPGGAQFSGLADVKPAVLALFKWGSADGLARATTPLQLSGSRNLNPKPRKTKPRKTWRGPVFRGRRTPGPGGVAGTCVNNIQGGKGRKGNGSTLNNIRRRVPNSIQGGLNSCSGLGLSLS